MKKFHYSVDKFNRLVIEEKKKKYSVEGEFEVRKNELVFFPSSHAQFTRRLDLPREIQFVGKWRLNENHDLCLVLTETDYQYRDDRLEIKGRVFSVEPAGLIFQTRFKKTPSEDRIAFLSLGRRWQSDASNQLIFLVRRDVEEDILKFSSQWKVNGFQQIVYTYEKKDLLSGEKNIQYIKFQGFWKISEKDRIDYILDLKNNSFFQFKGFWEIPGKQKKKGGIKCQIGVGAKKLRRENIFLLSGEWNFTEKNKLFFEIDYGERSLPGIVFKTDMKWDKDKNLVFSLKNRRDEPLGVELKFEKGFLEKNKRFFLRFSGSQKEKRLEGGVSIPW